MILADTSVWVDHLRSGDRLLEDLLNSESLFCHPLIIGEISMGSMRHRRSTLDVLQHLPSATEASHREALLLVETEELFSRGISFVDVHLLASVRLTRDAKLWTRDRRLHEAATQLGVAWSQDRPH